MGAGSLSVGILIDRWEPERGGAERCLAYLAGHLERKGHRVHAFAERASAGAPGRFHRVKGGTSAFGLLRGPRERALGRRLVAAARQECDVTLGIRHLPEVDLFWPHGGSHLGALAGRARRTGRTSEPTGRHRTFLELERELVAGGGARSIACVSQLVEEEFARFYPGCEERLHRVPNGIDLEAITPERREHEGRALRARLGLAADVPVLVFAGRDPLGKGLPQLLHGLARLQDEPWCCLVAGVRQPARWRRLASASGLGPERVLFEPFVPAPELFALADLVVIPTWRDACLLAILESLAAGVPVVTTRHAGAAHLVSGNAGTVLDEPGDVEHLSAVVRSWLERVRAGDVDRADLRARVASRGLTPWLDQLEELLLELAT